MVRLRAFDALPEYRPGARPEAGDQNTVRLASNENPLAVLHRIRDRMLGALPRLNRYPDPQAHDLTRALAERHRTSPERIVVGAGSVALGALAVQVTCDPGDEVMYAWRSFEAYPIFAGLAHAHALPIPLRADGGHDLEAMAAAVTRRTRVVFLCSPNNPTGPIITTDGANWFCDQVSDDVLVVIDEAYGEFVRDPRAVDGAALAGERANVMSTRTLSKAYGLAGLRVGYAIGAPEVVAAFRRCTLPFSVSTLAQVAALAALDSERELQARADEIVAERGRVRDRLLDLGWQVPRAEGNFVWVPTTDSALAQRCASSGVLVRAFEGEGIRVTIGTREENDRFLALAAVRGMAGMG